MTKRSKGKYITEGGKKEEAGRNITEGGKGRLEGIGRQGKRSKIRRKLKEKYIKWAENFYPHKIKPSDAIRLGA